MASAQAVRFQKIAVSVQIVLTSLNLEEETLKSNAASECGLPCLFLISVVISYYNFCSN